jgi:uroporphyrin-III C-methyltransferase/precorrin-2 dehydrogenase/sirohydrochlorin ferrochelatase
MHSLPLFHRIAGQPVIVLGEGEAAAAKARLVERAGGRIVGIDDPAAKLAFVAFAEPEEAAAQFRARGVLVNVVDRPELCDFTVPSLLERGPVLVAVGTGGVSAGLAKQLRLRLESLLPATLGGLAEALGAARSALRQRWPDAAERRRALDAALGTGGALDPLVAEASFVAGWLAEADSAVAQAHEFSVLTGDPDDLTLRQARWLGTADVVAHEPGVASAILNRARADAVRVELETGQPAPEATGTVVVIRLG